MKPLHEELKGIRLEKGITLEDISQITKIRIHFLEQLEAGDFSGIPMPYIRAFLREYGKVIGVDPIRVMAKLDKKTTTVRDEPPITGSPKPNKTDQDSSAVSSEKEEEKRSQ